MWFSSSKNNGEEESNKAPGGDRIASRRRGDKRNSIVPTMAEVKLESFTAPHSSMPSLDFDRIVNAYSVMAVTRRITKFSDHRHERESVAPDMSFRTFYNMEGSSREAKRLLLTPNGKDIMRWFLTLAVGLWCGLMAVVIVFFAGKIQVFRTERLNWQLQFAAGSADISDPNNSTHFHFPILYLIGSIFGMEALKPHTYSFILAEYIIYNAMLASASSAMCILFAPNAVGSGIPEVKAYLNGVCVESFADINVFLTKIIGTIFAVSSGLIVGPEGPLVHLGAITGQGITKTTNLEIALRKFQTRFKKTSRFCGCASLDQYGDPVTASKRSRHSRLANAGLSFNPGGKRVAAVMQNRDLHPETEDEMHSLRVGDLRVSSQRSYGATVDRNMSNITEDDFEDDDDNNYLEPPSPEKDFLHKKYDIYEKPSQDSAETMKNKSSCCPNTKHKHWSECVSLLSRFRNDSDRRDLISIGVATGFAAAFGAPVGGLLYSFEEASSYFTIPLMWRTLAATAVGTFVIAIYNGDLSHFSVLSLGDEVVIEHVELANSFMELPFYVLIGVVGGLLGALFNASYVWANKRRQKFYGTRNARGFSAGFFRMMEVVMVSIVTSLVTFCLPVFLPKEWACTDLKGEYIENNGEDVRFNCPIGQFNEIATILLGSRDEALNDILTDPNFFEARTLLVCGLAAFFLMCITFGIFIPSGLFMPTLLTGSSLTGWAAIMIQRHLLPSMVPAHLALAGSTAMLAGIQRTTVSLCVIMMEATGQVKVLIPLIISVVTARYVADLFNEGFYHVSNFLLNSTTDSGRQQTKLLSLAFEDRYGDEALSLSGA